MITPAEALAAIAAEMRPFGSERVDLDRAAGRILRQAVSAERDQPPFDRVTMDGIALVFDAFAGGTRRFAIQAREHAGEPALTLTGPAQCIEVMTGAVLPVNADCVVPVERITVRNGAAEIEEGYAAERRQFVHGRGSDHREGTELLPAGAVVTPIDIAIIASCGLTGVEVAKSPGVRVISTGSELVAPGQPVAAHQIRLSNGPAVLAMLKAQGFDDVRHVHVVDDPAALRERVRRDLEEANVLILSGGVSMGKADFVPDVLAELGVKKVFHRISQRPGKPMWFGIGSRDQAVFGLPGNPVSTLVCCRHYVLPALLAAGGRPPAAPEYAVLAEDVSFKPSLTAFLPVRLQSDVDGLLKAKPVPTNTSGDFAALRGTDGYIELAQSQVHFPAGSPVPLHR
ncbi:MAG TPA: molybdopterin molybdotransferase MoeA, partial [Woeseiaceae bacterium]|nr:molybdopterin molybdotransferase MoeA [Woeseiaceae bacterium]